MPYVLRHRRTNEIAACIQRNKYDMDYYGVQWWPTESDADEERTRLLAQPGRSEEDEWQVLKVEETQLKLLNVKLKNNPKLKVYMDADGKTEVRAAHS